MKRKHHVFTEHYLVPTVLFLLNICVVHVIYAFASTSPYPIAGKAALAVALAMLAGSLWYRTRFLLAGSILFYAFVVVWM